MGAVIIACHTISDEVNKVIAEAGIDYPVIWIESGLHNFPETLRERLQEQINKIANVEHIILVYGYCGNALLGIYSHNAKLIIPRVDDCISLLLGSYQKREALSNELGTYFLTKGWIENENNIIKEYERCVERYGQEQSERVMKIMLEHYKRLVLIDTGAYSLDDECLEKSYVLAKKVGLRYQIETGSLNLLKKLLSGPWDDDFVILQPGEALSMDDFRMDLTNSTSNLNLFGFGREASK
ncbi:MAG TPA: DUF1638 domain-containing protein [Syntrophomonadaceae bacterium]|nr:DUF1638 domain-containing protein [Syntrophomonadaceae bacterium]